MTGNEREGRNWLDSKCVYGYVTLCLPCAQKVREANRRGDRSWRHVDATKEVPGFPVFKCERCKKGCTPPDSNAYQQRRSMKTRKIEDAQELRASLELLLSFSIDEEGHRRVVIDYDQHQAAIDRALRILDATKSWVMEEENQ